MVYLYFGNKLVSKQPSGLQDIKPHEAQEPFQIDLEIPDNDTALYTLIIVDNDAPYPNAASLSPYVHLFEYNIQGGDVNTGEYLFEYEAPNPPKDSPPHTYHVAVLKQPGHVEYHSENFPRENFPLELMTSLDQLVDELKFTVGDPPVGPMTTVALQNPMISKLPTPSVQIPTSQIAPSGRGQHDFFKKDTNLSEEQKKYCSCILKVTDKGGARIPYAVCAKTVGTTTRDCSVNYDFERMPDHLLRAQLKLHKMEIPSPWNRQQALQVLHGKW